MKKLFSILFLAAFTLTMFAQVPKITSKVKNLGSVSPGTILSINSNLADTITNGDTIFYKIVCNHDGFVTPYISLLHKKPGSRDTSSVMTYWQSVNGVDNWQPVLKGKALSSYSATIDTTSINNATVGNKGHTYSFLRDTAYFESQYLGIRIISNGATSGGKKGYYKPIYYGSIRFNKK
jgi:hypothetical protein